MTNVISRPSLRRAGLRWNIIAVRPKIRWRHETTLPDLLIVILPM